MVHPKCPDVLRMCGTRSTSWEGKCVYCTWTLSHATQFFRFPTDYKRSSSHTDWRWKEEKGLGFRSIDYQLINGWHFSPTLRWEWLCHFWLNSLRMSATLKNNFRQLTFPEGKGKGAGVGRQGKAIANMTRAEIPVERAPHKRKYDSKSKQHALCNKSSARGFILLRSKNALCQLEEERIPSLLI